MENCSEQLVKITLSNSQFAKLDKMVMSVFFAGFFLEKIFLVWFGFALETSRNAIHYP